jgi:predicted methyltransferase
MRTPLPMRPVLAALAALTVLFVAAPAPAARSIYEQALAAAGRRDQERARDERDQPAAVLAFAGFKPGMRIADVFGAGGYFARL